ncbi:MAG: hypothetical protein ACNA77_03915 [Opitutales bacterium]
MNSSAIIEKIKQYPVALACGVILALFVVIFFARSSVVSELTLQETELNSRLRAIEENIKNSKNLKEDKEKLDVMVDQITGLLFNRFERAININFFYGLEDDSGVVISNIAQLPNPDGIYADKGARELKLYSTLVYNINMKGSFSNILQFLYELDRVDPIMRVADFYVTREEEGLGGASVDARLRLLVLAKKN